MATREEMLAEAYSRGLLNPQQKAAYEEAGRRGLVKGVAQQGASAARSAAQREASKMGGFDRSVMQGLSSGFDDEMKAKVAGVNTRVINFLADLGIAKRLPYGGREAEAATLAVQREAQKKYAKEHPVRNIAGTAFGGLPWAVTPGTGAAGAVASAGGRGGAASVARAAASGAAFGGAFGAGSGEDAKSRTTNALTGIALGGATGGALQAGGNALLSGLRAPAGASAQRLLSRQGINLTPGQMMGPAASKLEDVAAGIPGLGVKGARNRQLDQFDKVAIDRALAPLGKSLPRKIKAGRQAIAHARQEIGKAYDAALNPVTITPRPDLQQAVSGARSRLQGAALDDFNTIMADIEPQLMGTFSGRAMKEFDEELGKAAQSALGANSRPSDRSLARSLQAVQDALDAELGATSQGALAAKNAADEAYANFVRVERASASSGARSGRFSPAQLNQAVRQSDPSKRKGAYGRGEALMQDLTDPAMEVLPQQLADSGTPLRLGAMAGAGAAGSVFAPAVVAKLIPIVAASNAVYSRPAIAALNAMYRATDGIAAQKALGDFATLAARHPELQPAYAELLAAMPDPNASGQQKQTTAPAY